jgi:hypothetical protein
MYPIPLHVKKLCLPCELTGAISRNALAHSRRPRLGSKIVEEQRPGAANRTGPAHSAYDSERGHPTGMNPKSSTTLAATLIGTAAGTISWLTGIARAMWPDHPQLGVLLITVFTGLVVFNLWPAIFRKRG